MNSVLQKRNFFMNIDFALFSLLLTILLQWIVLIEVGGFLVRPYHVTMILLFVSIFFNRNLLTYTRGLLRTGYYFFVVILFFFIMEMLSLLWTTNIGSGISSIVRLFLYVFMAFSVAIKLANIHSNKIIKTIFWGSLFGVVTFFLTINVYLNFYGINFIADYYSALASRNLLTVVSFFRKFYSTLGGGDAWNTDTLRHSLSGLSIIFALLFRLTMPIMKENFKNKSFLTIIEVLLYSFSTLIVLMSLSRSGMLALLMVFNVFFFIKILSGKLKAYIVLIIILIVLCSVFLVIFYDFHFCHDRNFLGTFCRYRR